jgi:hypothetical protein
MKNEKYFIFKRKILHCQNSFKIQLKNGRTRGKIDTSNTYTWYMTVQFPGVGWVLPLNVAGLNLFYGPNPPFFLEKW